MASAIPSSGLYDYLQRRVQTPLVNKVKEGSLWFDEKEDKLFDKFGATFRRSLIGMMPCYCDVLRVNVPSISALKKPLED